MEPLVATCDWLVTQVQLHAALLVPQLQPGLSKEVITAHLADLHGHLSQEVLAFYGWHNGQALNHDGDLMPWHLFVPLERARRVYQQTLGQRGPYARWHETWWPIWIDEDGRQTHFVASQPHPHAASPIYTLGTSHHRQEVWMAYDSLTTMLATLAACYATGAYWLAWT